VTPELARVLVLLATSVFAGLIVLVVTREDAGIPQPARRRARRLFLAKLDGKQRVSWLLRRRFDVAARSGRRYTISAYRPFNICTGDAVFCVQISGRIPMYDKLLAQKLLIEADESLFFAYANLRTESPAWAPLLSAARLRYPQVLGEARSAGS